MTTNEPSRQPSNSIALIFFPYDIGCERNGGRPGSKHGPQYFYKQFEKLPKVSQKHNSDISDLMIHVIHMDPDMILEVAHKLLQSTVSTQ